MISAAYCQGLARYNRDQNQSLYREAAKLSEDQRREDRGVFFGSIQRTLCHILTADHIWMSRFDDWEMPDARGDTSPDWIAIWDGLKALRMASDTRLIEWADRLKDTSLKADLSWERGAEGEVETAPSWTLVAHMFNHQTHHRGQVHAMLTGFGMVPDETDLKFKAIT